MFLNDRVQAIKNYQRDIMKLALIYSECLRKRPKIKILVVDNFALSSVIVDPKEWIHMVSPNFSHNISKLVFQIVGSALHNSLHQFLHSSILKKPNNKLFIYPFVIDKRFQTLLLIFGTLHSLESECFCLPKPSKLIFAISNYQVT